MYFDLFFEMLSCFIWWYWIIFWFSKKKKHAESVIVIDSSSADTGYLQNYVKWIMSRNDLLPLNKKSQKYWKW